MNKDREMNIKFVDGYNTRNGINWHGHIFDVNDASYDLIKMLLSIINTPQIDSDVEEGIKSLSRIAKKGYHPVKEEDTIDYKINTIKQHISNQQEEIENKTYDNENMNSMLGLKIEQNQELQSKLDKVEDIIEKPSLKTQEAQDLYRAIMLILKEGK
jgi:hypothetical protein